MSARFVMGAGLAGLAVLALAPAPARADTEEPVPVEAKALAARGGELYGKAEYAGAIAAYKEAYVLAPAPGLLFNLAQAYRLAGNCGDAAYMYRRFLASAPPDDERAVAQTHADSMERCAHRRGLGISEESGASSATTGPMASGPQDAPAQPGRHKMALGIGTGVAGGIALALGVYEGVQASSASSDVEAAYARGDRWELIAPLQTRGEHAQTAERWLLAGGGIAVVAGAALFVMGRREARRVSPVMIIPASGGATVAATWNF